MLLNDAAFDKLSSRVEEFEGGRSSHWRHEQTAFTFDQNAFSGVGPMGTFSQSKGLLKTAAHYFFQIPFRLYGQRYKNFRHIDQVARQIANRQGRQYDLDLLRHTLTLAFLQTHLELQKKKNTICVIGDGFANMSSVILGATPQNKVILVNLVKSLIVDLICMRKAFPDLTYALVDTPEGLLEAMQNDDVQAILIGANNADILTGADLDLAINIESMMEMSPSIIQDYFDILRSGHKSKIAFYCCNLEFKQFSGEGTSNFFEYPWQAADDILIHETCPWTIFRYGNTPPFYAKRDKDLHRLVYLQSSKNSSI